MKVFIFFIVVYLVAAFLTYGYVYNEVYAWWLSEYPKLEERANSDARLEAPVAAVLWPVYWPARLSRVMFAKLAKVDKE